MKLKILLGILVFLIVLNLATIGTFLYVHFTRPSYPSAVLAPEGAPDGTPHSARPWLRRLPSEHREGLHGLLREFHSETYGLRLRIRDLENRTFELMQLDSIPAAEVDSLLREISTARFEISRIAAGKLIKAKTVLPPDEQRAFFDAILQARPSPPGVPGPHHREGYPRGRGRRTHADSL